LINVLTLNAHMGFDLLKRRFILAALREAIREVCAEIVCLQEVLGEHALHARRHAQWPAVAHYEYLAEMLWPQFSYGRNAVYPHGHHGNAVLSKFPISSFANHDVSVPGHEPRGVLHAVLQVPGWSEELQVFCVHLGLHEAHRQQQIGLLCARVAALSADAPVVVAGDFNDWRARGHPLLTRCGLVEAVECMHGRVARSFPSRFPVLPLDRIYLRNLRVVQARVLSGLPWSRLSDHLPLLASIAP